MLNFAAAQRFASWTPRRALARAACLSLALLAGAVAAPTSLLAETSKEAEADAAKARDAIIDKISAYLNSVKTITGKFRQVSSDDLITDGDYAIRRPGRMYFRYAPPSYVRVVADGFWVAVFDEKNDPAIDRYPLSETPLYLLLKKDVDLRKEKAVKKVEETEKFYRITVFDPSGDTQGDIMLVFDKAPLRLREWTVTDVEGNSTKVVLRTSVFNVKVDPALFVIEQEKEEKIGD
ncbi:MAG: outer membrane lipoprotein carrier protein LolA [Neomegalonema sp.]|nr:outer membrane lipoprotein carrier protein LolA [Neomegalonema sp.]